MLNTHFKFKFISIKIKLTIYVFPWKQNLCMYFMFFYIFLKLIYDNTISIVSHFSSHVCTQLKQN